MTTQPTPQPAGDAAVDRFEAFLCRLLGGHHATWAITQTGYACRCCGRVCNQHGVAK